MSNAWTRSLLLAACVIAGCASPTTEQTQSIPPAAQGGTDAAASSPAERRGDTASPPPETIDTTAQQAAGNLAANVEANLRTEIAALKAEQATIKGIEYRSDLPWKAVVLCVGVVLSQQMLTMLAMVLSHRREMARIRRG